MHIFAVPAPISWRSLFGRRLCELLLLLRPKVGGGVACLLGQQHQRFGRIGVPKSLSRRRLRVSEAAGRTVGIFLMVCNHGKRKEKKEMWWALLVLSRMLVFFKKLASLADNCGQTTNSQIITSNTQSQYLFFLPLSISTKLSSFSLLSFFPPKKGAVF